MRAFLLLFPALLMAQTPPATPPPAAKAASTSKAGTPAKAAPAKAAPASSTTAKSPAKAAAPAGTLTTDDQKSLYAIGLSMAQSLSRLDFSASDMEFVRRGLMDGAAGKPLIKFEEWQPKLQGFVQTRTTRAMAQEKIRAKAFLDKAATEPGATRTPSGLVYRELAAGTGPSPKATDKVKVNYRGSLTNGTEFDSSYARNQPAEFPLNGVIPCWTEGVQRMKVGGKSMLTCPSDIAYGDGGQPPKIPGGATLVFEVELLGINP